MQVAPAMPGDVDHSDHDSSDDDSDDGGLDAEDEPAAAAAAAAAAAGGVLAAGAVAVGGDAEGDNTFGGLQTPLAIVLAAVDAVRNRVAQAYDEMNDAGQPLAANAALELAYEGNGLEGLLEDAVAGEVMLPVLATSTLLAAPVLLCTVTVRTAWGQ